MKVLQVPFNNELDILSLYESWAPYITEIYFGLHPSIFPNARQNKYPTIEEYNKVLIELCSRMSAVNIKPMATLNGIKINYSDTNLDKIINNLNFLTTYGLKGVIVADPIIAAYINAHIPNLTIRLSVLSGIRTIEKIKEIETLGYIKEICLPQDLNRNEDVLIELKEKTSIKYSTIVNSLCRINCPMFYWHQNMYCSNGEDLFGNNVEQIKRTLSDMIMQLSNNPLKAPFILPEELNYYDKYFCAYKLEDRTLPSFKIAEILTYYALRINPTFLIDCISGSCNYLKLEQKASLPNDWLKYRRNCKGQCYQCSYCDKVWKEQ